jgi:hypothetical protein
MTAHPPSFQQVPPPVGDRRAPERRSRGEGRHEERQAALRTAVASASAACAGLVMLFVFFWALGAINVKDAAAAAIVVLALTAVWIGGYLYSRGHITADALSRSKHDRERRGF